MAEFIAIHDRVLDPWGKQVFDENTRFSQHFLSHELNRLLEVVEDDSIIRGIEITDYNATTSKFSITISDGDLIHDKTYFEITDPTIVEFELYKYIDIVDVNISESYFSIDGNWIKEFKTFTNFAIVGSTGNDNVSWITTKTEYDLTLDQTKIFVASPISNATIDGQIIYRVVKDTETTAKLLCFTRFQYLKTPNSYMLQYCLDYLRNDGTVAHGWSVNQDRILLGVFEFEKNATDTEIVSASFRQLTEQDLEDLSEHDEFQVYTRVYKVRNDVDFAAVDDYIDGGQI